MEKFFVVKKESNLYVEYFDFIKMSDRLNDEFKKFAIENGIKSTRYYQTADRLCIEQTKEDRLKFSQMLVANSDTDFKKSSKICKDWVSICKKNEIKTPREPSLIFYINSHSNKYSQRLFHIDDVLYGSFDNKIDLDFNLGKDFEELKGSEFYKILEDDI